MKDYVDASGAYRMFGEDFIDCRGNWCRWGEGFYDYEGNYIRWGNTYKDSSGAYQISFFHKLIEDGEKTLLMGQEIGYVCK